MLSAKNVKLHGMKDERWTTKDKLIQYRGILKLHARDRKLQVISVNKLKKKVSRDLKDLTSDVKEYRGIMTDIMNGDQRRMHMLLQHHRDFQLAYDHLKPSETYAAIFQDSALKRKLLNKLYYTKKKKMKEFFDLQLECALLADKYEQEQEYKPNYLQQTLITNYQRFIAKMNAAAAIRETYICMSNILKKDAVYFDAVLDALKVDQKVQCQILIKATVMGQLAAENLDDTRQKYKQMAQDVWVNMRERERTLKNVRSQVDDLWAYAQSLVRVESDTDFTEKKIIVTKSEEWLQSQIRHLEDIFDKTKESMLVRSYDEVFPRLEEQMRQKARLLVQFNHNLIERDSILNKKHHALLILASLEHSMIGTTGQYKADKKIMLDQIETQKKREADFKNMRKIRGELLMNIRAAMQNMVSMLVYIKRGKSVKKIPKENEKKSKKSPVIEEKEDEEFEDKISGEEEPQFEKIDEDGLTLLTQVTRKVGMLFSMSGFQLDEEREVRAKDLYQTYISDYRSKLKYGVGEPEPTGLYVEHEVIDSNVLTRADIKLRSRQLVEAHLKPE
ncbi:uncharacterized protein LOC107274516 [Cephus cinctus]|uniref:Uncharacterized protein LOC107274516 n=1 Tax=Cephus cinctus TaxID=211228 RepID=A0AAJ7RVM6_CEPCN|nr:uncharacterized protein LOC107274516 [Cephus cinctus]